MVRRQNGQFTWDGVEIHPYKEEGTHFKSIHRQTLFKGDAELPVEFRYFEIGPGGHSTLERHDHQHIVMVIRGEGQVLIGEEISSIRQFDVVHIPPQTWHQFQATQDCHLGFLCVVNQERDKPHRPDEGELDQIASKTGEFARA
jgi:quercetin dioxygenase-like cupin family protein